MLTDYIQCANKSALNLSDNERIGQPHMAAHLLYQNFSEEQDKLENCDAVNLKLHSTYLEIEFVQSTFSDGRTYRPVMDEVSAEKKKKSQSQNLKIKINYVSIVSILTSSN